MRSCILLLVCGLPAAAAPELRLDVPFVRQEKNGCGAASIAMVMQYWQQQEHGLVPPDAETVQRALYSRAARGIYASDLEVYLRRHGFRTFAIRGEWSDLVHNLEKGRPLIVALRSGRDDLHYVVITGIDQDAVLKHDPARRALVRQSRAEFEKDWKVARNWTLLAVPEHDSFSSR
jgi:ABC-type bacteriocin/lantibiotic exporter with double-glycine peptidase domain